MPSPSPKRWTALWIIALAQFMVIMDTSIIGVALPETQRDLGFIQGNLSWVFNAYVIAFGGLLLLGGRLSDLFSAKRMFAVGWVVLAAGSLIAGLAGSEWLLIVGRAIQGVGAAAIAPSALTLLMMLFGHDPKQLTKALALYGAAAPAGGTTGVFLGGVITEWISWPWVFYINLPIATLVLAAHSPAHAQRDRRRPVDTGLGLIGLSLARPDGNFAADVLAASLVAAAGMALAFIPSLGTAISSAPPE